MPNEFDPIRSQISQKLRADSEELEELTQTARLRQQNLSEALSETMASGGVVTASCGERATTGTLTMVINDLAVITAESTEASVHLVGPISLAIEGQTTGGTSGSRSVRSFVARLKELELSGEPVEIVGSFGAKSGTIDIVAEEHVRLIDGSKTWLLPLTQIGIVVRPTPPSPGPG